MEELMTGEEFAKALSDGTLDSLGYAEVYGLLAKHDTNDKVLRYSPTLSGRLWVDLPIDQIEAVEWVTRVDAGTQSATLMDPKHPGQTHNLVRIQLKEPKADQGSDARPLVPGSLAGAVVNARPRARTFAKRPASGPAAPQTATAERLALGFPKVPGFLGQQIDRVSHFSSCAKCTIEVKAVISGAILTVTLTGGLSAPGIAAVWQTVVAEHYGLAVWEAIKAYIFSEGEDSIAKRICQALKKCG